jgi:acetate kinase
MKINLILAVNGGSSSIKLALYEAGETLRLTVKAEMENIGRRDTKLTFTLVAPTGSITSVSKPLIIKPLLNS